MFTAKELNELAKQMLDAKFSTDDNLERVALDAGAAALLQMKKRAEKAAA